MKKIFIVAPLSSGHLQKWVKPFLGEYQFIFFTLHNIQLPDEFNGFKKYCFPRITNTRFDFLLAIPYLQFLVLKHSPDILYASFLSSYGLLSASVFSNCKRFLSVWGTDVNGKPQKNLLIKKLVSFFCNRFALVNSPAEHIKEKLVDLGFDRAKIEVFQYGIDFPKYKIKNLNVTNSQYFSDKNVVKFLSIRNWDELYNISLIVKSYASFCSSVKVNTELTIIGKGSEVELVQLRKLISHLNFSCGKVNLIGFVGFEDMNQLMLEHDVVISVPIMDGTPLSLLESMYVGLLPIVSEIDANKEWLNMSNAVYTDFKDLPFCFKSALDFLYSEKIELLLSNNRERVVKDADYNINTSRLFEMFFKIR